ncbi:MAG: hypothetical protein H7836_10935 [Magnetococcus sp. YQC-3]
MAESPFMAAVAQIETHLQRAILQGDEAAIGPAARELRRHWAVALVQGDRVGFQRVNDALLTAASMAHTYAEPGDALAGWCAVWDFIAEAGTLIRRLNMEWSAASKLAEIPAQRSRYAEPILRFLLAQGTTSSARLVEHMWPLLQEGQTPQTAQDTEEERKRRATASLNNHLRRLMSHGLVGRTGWGSYQLTTLGEYAARSLEERARKEKKNIKNIIQLTNMTVNQKNCDEVLEWKSA